MANILRSVRSVFKNYPLASNCLVYGSLYAGAEFSQQTIIRKVKPDTPEDYDLPLVARYGILGSTAFPTFLYFWYKFLDVRMVSRTPMGIAAKVIVDQMVTAPPILATFYVGMSIMERKEDIFKECKEKLLPTFKSSCMFWVPAQAINFMFLPSSLRVVYIGTCSFLWINVLCVLKREDTTEVQKKEE